MPELMPRYPVYIPSKSRPDSLTAQMFDKDEVPFWIVVEPQEADLYRSNWGDDRVLVLPFRDAGTSVPARNWIRDHAEASGAEKHWQFDDNIRTMYRSVKRQRVYCRAGVALHVCEVFSDRYENVGISGFNYTMFAPTEISKTPPFYLNCHVYSACLFNHEMPHRWRGTYNEDTDLCLQALSTGWCTVALNAFTADKIRTMKMTGGNSQELYHGDGRLRMARALERNWPGVVKVTRKFQRPQHSVNWDYFDVPLRRKPEFAEIPDEPDNFGMKVTAVKEVKSPKLREVLD